MLRAKAVQKRLEVLQANFEQRQVCGPWRYYKYLFGSFHTNPVVWSDSRDREATLVMYLEVLLIFDSCRNPGHERFDPQLFGP